METAKKEKEKDIDYNKSSAQKLKEIRRNRAVEKEHNTLPSNTC